MSLLFALRGIRHHSLSQASLPGHVDIVNSSLPQHSQFTCELFVSIHLHGFIVVSVTRSSPMLTLMTSEKDFDSIGHLFLECFISLGFYDIFHLLFLSFVSFFLSLLFPAISSVDSPQFSNYFCTFFFLDKYFLIIVSQHIPGSPSVMILIHQH